MHTYNGGGPGHLDAKPRAEAGLVWTRFQGNPGVGIALSGNRDSAGVGTPAVLREADDYHNPSGYKMYYSSYDGAMYRLAAAW